MFNKMAGDVTKVDDIIIIVINKINKVFLLWYLIIFISFSLRQRGIIINIQIIIKDNSTK